MREISEEAVALLQTMTWPGNVRQLKNLIERVLILGDGILARLRPRNCPPRKKRPTTRVVWCYRVPLQPCPCAKPARRSSGNTC